MNDQTNILLVDDQPADRLILRSVLQPLGHNLVEARSGPEALQLLLEDDFAVVLLDVRMPGMDGFETAAHMREQERSRGVPIIFLTAGGQSEADLWRGYTAGAVDYLFKPVAPQILRAKAGVFVELFRLKRARARQLEETQRRNQELALANQDLEAFSYAVAKSLQPPLRHIQGFLRVLQERSASVLDERARRFLDRVGEAGRRMSRLIEGLLVYGRAAHAEIRPARVRLARLVEEVVELLEPETLGRSVEWKIGALPEVDGDAELLRVALHNLVANALKYTRLRAEACIEIDWWPGRPETVVFVRDNGIGFNHDQSAKIFEPFQRLRIDAAFEGTGLGLATVRRVIERHGGRVWAESRPDHGATFYMALPKKGTA